MWQIIWSILWLVLHEFMNIQVDNSKRSWQLCKKGIVGDVMFYFFELVGESTSNDRITWSCVILFFDRDTLVDQL